MHLEFKHIRSYFELFRNLIQPLQKFHTVKLSPLISSDTFLHNFLIYI